MTVVCCLAIGALTARAVVGGAAEVGSKEDQKKLQGAWVGLSVERRGSKLSAEEAKKFRVVIDGDRFTILLGDQAEKGTYRLGAAGKERTIILTNDRKERRFGIYEFAGGGLKLCLSGPGRTPPARFEGGHELNAVLKKRAD
jgi:uncharacterized protein (TIGR03067 family)